MGKSVKVTVLDGTVNDGKKDYVRGDVLSMDAMEAAALAKAGIIAEGEVNLSASSVTSAAPQPLSAAQYAKFQDAVLELDEANDKQWTGDGKPDLAALKENGCVMTAAERDEAWDLYSKPASSGDSGN